MRKQRIDAGLRLRGIENELGLAALLRHSVVVRDGDLSERLPIRGHAIAEHGVIHGVADCRKAQRSRKSANDQP